MFNSKYFVHDSTLLSTLLIVGYADKYNCVY